MIRNLITKSSNDIKNKLPLSGSVILFFVILFLAGCMQDELCEDLTDNPLRIGFYSEQNGEIIPESVDSLSVKGLSKDELLYDNQFNVGRIEVPLDVSVDSCGFVLTFPENTDTLMLYYERNLSLVSIECGFVTFFEITDVKSTNNTIQSFLIEESNVTNINEEHIHIFFPVDPD